jgi:phosphatidylglycerophosphate synthase
MFKKHFSKYKEEFKQATKDLKHKDTFYKQIPNILTFMRLVLAIPAGILYYFNPILSVITIGFLWLTDAVDGKIARKLDIQSKLGADMDTVADKLMFLGSAIPLLSSLPFLGLNFLLEGTIAGINLFGRMKGLDTRTVYSGKVKTVGLALTLISGYLNYLFPIERMIMVFLIMFTTIFQTIAIYDYVEQYEKLNKEKNKKDFVESIKEENKTISNEKTNDISKDLNNGKIEEYRELRNLVLASQLSSKKYTGKKRTRIMMQEKKNNN